MSVNAGKAFRTVLTNAVQPKKEYIGLCSLCRKPLEAENTLWPGPGELPVHKGQCPVDQTNPKDTIGETKVPLGLLPAAGKLYGAMAMRDGARKYGPYNWRSKNVRMTIYLDAIERHLLALRDGEDVAPDSGVPHLGHIIACGALLADAVEGGFLVDDRPPAGPAATVLERFREKRA